MTKPNINGAQLQKALYACLATSARSVQIPPWVRSDPELFAHVEWVMMGEGRCAAMEDANSPLCTMPKDHPGAHGWSSLCAGMSQLSI